MEYKGVNININSTLFQYGLECEKLLETAQIYSKNMEPSEIQNVRSLYHFFNQIENNGIYGYFSNGYHKQNKEYGIVNQEDQIKFLDKLSEFAFYHSTSAFNEIRSIKEQFSKFSYIPLNELWEENEDAVIEYIQDNISDEELCSIANSLDRDRCFNDSMQDIAELEGFIDADILEYNGLTLEDIDDEELFEFLLGNADLTRYLDVESTVEEIMDRDPSVLRMLTTLSVDDEVIYNDSDVDCEKFEDMICNSKNFMPILDGYASYLLKTLDFNININQRDRLIDEMVQYINENTSWNCNVDYNPMFQNKDEIYISIEKETPLNDFLQIDFVHKKIPQLIMKEIREYIESFNPDERAVNNYQAAIQQLDDPYPLKALLEDAENALKDIKSLYSQLDNEFTESLTSYEHGDFIQNM